MKRRGLTNNFQRNKLHDQGVKKQHQLQFLSEAKVKE